MGRAYVEANQTKSMNGSPSSEMVIVGDKHIKLVAKRTKSACVNCKAAKVGCGATRPCLWYVHTSAFMSHLHYTVSPQHKILPHYNSHIYKQLQYRLHHQQQPQAHYSDTITTYNLQHNHSQLTTQYIPCNL